MPYGKIMCEYKVKSLSNISISGINASNGISLANRPKATSILSGTANHIPLEFTVDVDIENNGKYNIEFTEFYYSIMIDNILFAKEQMSDTFELQDKETKTLMLPVNVDVRKLMDSENKNEVSEVIKSLIGIKSPKVNMVVKLEPTLKIKDKKFNYPSPLYLNYSIGK